MPKGINNHAKTGSQKDRENHGTLCLPICKIMQIHNTVVNKQGFARCGREQEIHQIIIKNASQILPIIYEKHRVFTKNRTNRDPTCRFERRKLWSRNLCGNMCPTRPTNFERGGAEEGRGASGLMPRTGEKNGYQKILAKPADPRRNRRILYI